MLTFQRDAAALLRPVDSGGSRRLLTATILSTWAATGGRDPLAPASVRDVLFWERNEPDHAERPAPWRQRSIAPRYRQDWRGMDALLKKVLSERGIPYKFIPDVAVVSRGLNWERSQDARLRSDLPTSPSVSRIYHFQVARPQRPLWFTRGGYTQAGWNHTRAQPKKR